MLLHTLPSIVSAVSHPKSTLLFRGLVLQSNQKVFFILNLDLDKMHASMSLAFSLPSVLHTCKIPAPGTEVPDCLISSN